MATTRIIPMHINKGKTIAQCLSDRTEYAMNPDKTEAGEFVPSFACDPKTADMEFLLSKSGGCCARRKPPILLVGAYPQTPYGSQKCSAAAHRSGAYFSSR